MPRDKLPTKASLVEPAVHATPLRRKPGDATTELSIEAYEGLPGLIVEIAEIGGLNAALAIAAARGGNRIYIPLSAPDDHWLVKTAGRAAADKIMAHFAPPSGIELDMPRGPTGSRANLWRQLYRMIEEGYSSSEITRRLGISRDMVKYHRAKLRTSTSNKQLSLFALLDDQAD